MNCQICGQPVDESKARRRAKYCSHKCRNEGSISVFFEPDELRELRSDAHFLGVKVSELIKGAVKHFLLARKWTPKNK